MVIEIICLFLFVKKYINVINLKIIKLIIYLKKMYLI